MLPTSRVSERYRGRTAGLPIDTTRSADGIRRSLLSSVIALVLLSGLSGCTLLQNGFKSIANNSQLNETVMVLRNRSFSAKAWHRRKHHFCNEKYIKDFRAGFRTGYEDTANGKDGCTPAFPPKEYWSWQFQSAEGQQRMAAWFAGYPQGARAAEEDGVGYWSQLQMGAAMQSQYPCNEPPAQHGSLYPIPSGPVHDGAAPHMPAQGYPVEELQLQGAPTVPYPAEAFDLPPGAEIIPDANSL